MKTLYLECNMGAAGDMLMAALLELCPDRSAFLARLNGLGIPGLRAEAVPAESCGICGTHLRITVNGEEEHSHDVHDHDHDHDHAHGHEHSHEHEDHEHTHDHAHGHFHAHPADIAALISSLPVSERTKADARAVYDSIADAESRVHGKPVTEIHFHEVGTLDAVADVVGVCMLMEQLAPDEIVASPVHVGSGNVRCAHGILPVPAPATALLLEGIPTYGGSVAGELCTPTGAALLKHFVTRFGDRPVMRTEKIGYGMGSKEFDRANCVRAFLGECDGGREEIVKLECNLDDMTGEAVGYAMEVLFEAGARDVYTQAIGMKKSRPGILLSVLCLPEDADRLAGLLLKHTTTLGVRRQSCSRYVLERTTAPVETELGSVRVKTGSGMGVTRQKAEYEDLAALARANGLSLAEAEAVLRKALEK